MAVGISADGQRLEGDSFPDWNLKFSVVITSITSVNEVNYWNDVGGYLQQVCVVFFPGGAVVVPEVFATLAPMIWPPAGG